MQIRCPHCMVPFESTEELSWSDLSCPYCGGSFSLAGVDATCSYRPGFEVLGRFVLLQEVGSGRFGSVWKAHDTQLQRNVAVKIPRQRNLDQHETELFLRDARAAAQLKHPRIASVHEVGREHETVYIVTDFIDGANLQEWLTSRRPAPVEAAELMVKIAEAVHHAHDAGVVHRDLKPSNIMMDGNGEPHVIDFGLARRDVGEMTVTMEGQVLGTPAYMSPEQARGEGHTADRRSDVYSLGVVLFKLLTNELPFRGQMRMLIVQILDQEPPNPRQLDSNVPRDLATITLKCLEKDPAKRYQTAGDLADELKRYVDGEPIKARPVGGLERAWRWSKRHREVASLSALLLILLLAASIVAPIVAVQQHELRVEAERQVANNLFQRAAVEYDAGRLMQAIALLSGAYDRIGPHSPLSDSILNLLAGWDSKGWRPIVTDDAVIAAALSPDGKTALIGGHGGNCVARFWDVQTTTPIGKPLQHEDSIRCVTFSHDGKRALTGSADGTARLWDVQSGKLLQTFRHAEPHPWAVAAVAISPDGNTVATGGNEGARLWDANTGTPLGNRLRHDSPRVFGVAFSPDGRLLLTGGLDGTARLWEVQSQQPVQTPIHVGKNVYAVAFTPDGTRIVTGNANGMVQLWDASTLRPIGDPLRHSESMDAEPEEAYAVACSPDGRNLLSGSYGHTARLWDIHAERAYPVDEPLRHGGPVMSVAFGPGGDTALTGSADRTARLWKLHDSRILLHGGVVHATAFSPDGRVVLTGGDDKTARLWNARTCEPIGKPMVHDSAVLAVAFSSDGTAALTGCDDQRVRRWNAQTGNELSDQEPWHVRGAVRQIEICNDHRTSLVRCVTDASQIIQLWELATGTPLSGPLQLDVSETVVARSLDGKTLLILRADGITLELVDVATGKVIAALLLGKDVWSRNEWKMSAAFSNDCRLLVTGAFDQSVRMWNAKTGAAIGDPFSHNGVVNAVVIGRDGQTILSGSHDRTAQLWDARSQAALGPPLQHSKPVSKVALSPDGNARPRLALTVCNDGSAHLWDVSSGKPLARPLQYEVAIEEGAFNADATVILFKCKDGTVRLYEVPQPRHGNPTMIRSWARARTGFELDNQGALRQLSQSQWLEAQNEWLRAQNDVEVPGRAP